MLAGQAQVLHNDNAAAHLSTHVLVYSYSHPNSSPKSSSRHSSSTKTVEYLFAYISEYILQARKGGLYAWSGVTSEIAVSSCIRQSTACTANQKSAGT